MYKIIKYIIAAGIAVVMNAVFGIVFLCVMVTAFIIVTAIVIACFAYCYTSLEGGWDSYFKTEHDYMCCSGGSTLIFETPDSCLTCKDLHMDPSRMYSITPYSIYTGKDTVTIGESYDSIDLYDKWLPLFVHRTNGRIDTLCTSICCQNTCTGYIQREYKDDNWLIVESKQPDKILGNTHLVDKRAINYKGRFMNDYDYEGQYIVFNSKLSDYWIASRHSPDLYGPMNIKELKRVGTSLGIEFPITLESNIDWKVCPDINGTDVSEQYKDPNRRKSIIDWYHWFFTRRPDRVIR